MPAPISRDSLNKYIKAVKIIISRLYNLVKDAMCSAKYIICYNL